MRVAILQPHYLGYCGLYGLLSSCEIFMVYDDVQFEHQSWQHRNKIIAPNNNQGWQWLIVPVVRNEGQLIKDVKIDNSKNWREKHWKSIQQVYCKAPHFKDNEPFLSEIYGWGWSSLVKMNMVFLKSLARNMKVKLPKIVYSSDYKTEGNKTDRLIPLLKAVGATTFIEGMAGKDYLDVKKLNDNGIEVLWYDYKHPIYPQYMAREFLPYMSVLDLLFNVGDKSMEYIKQGVRLASQ